MDDLNGWRPVDLGDPDLNREVNMMSAAVDLSEPVWWWLSFVDGHTGVFEGVAIVRAPNVVMACREAHQLGCNPGGDVAGVEMPPEYVPGERWCNRLLTKAETDVAGNPLHRDFGRAR